MSMRLWLLITLGCACLLSGCTCPKNEAANAAHLDMTNNAVVHTLAERLQGEESSGESVPDIRRVTIFATDDDFCTGDCGCGGRWYGWMCRTCGKVCACGEGQPGEQVSAQERLVLPDDFRPVGEVPDPDPEAMEHASLDWVHTGPYTYPWLATLHNSHPTRSMRIYTQQVNESEPTKPIVKAWKLYPATYQSIGFFRWSDQAEILSAVFVP